MNKKIAVRIISTILTVLLLSLSLLVAASANEGEEEITAAPPMGFNTWYTYLDGFTDKTIKDVVNAIKNKGLLDLGYKWIQIDWGWCAGDRGYDVRDEEGNMVPDPNKFSSMNVLANYLHRRGFKIGYYTDIGDAGCGNGIGSYGYYQQDVEQFLKWDVDFIKIDSCGGKMGYSSHEEAYRAFLDCVVNSGTERDVAINICCGGGYGVTEFITGMADDYVGDTIPFIYYRTCADISASIPTVLWEDSTYGVLRSFDMAMAHPENSRPGCYFDLDTLMLENNGLSAEENKSYFTMFCIAPSTLMLAVDVPNMTEETLALISNEEAIAVNQDPLCNAARLVREDTSGLQVYSKVQSDDNGHRVRAVMLLNRSAQSAEISVSWSDIGLEGDCSIRDIWEKADVGTTSDGYSATVPSHGVVFLKVTESAVTGTTAAETDAKTDSDTGNAENTGNETSGGAGEESGIGVKTVIIICAAAAVIIIAAVTAAVLKKSKK